ncbi:hypothetical protein QQP08_004148 [Theobroma cacao]|nr:hypothetical protein QQP08_004148 [Theobroma cacao]
MTELPSTFSFISHSANKKRNAPLLCYWPPIPFNFLPHHFLLSLCLTHSLTADVFRHRHIRSSSRYLTPVVDAVNSNFLSFSGAQFFEVPFKACYKRSGLAPEIFMS